MYSPQLVKCKSCFKWFEIPFITQDFSLDLSIIKEYKYFKCPDCKYESCKNVLDGKILELSCFSTSDKMTDNPYKIEFKNPDLHIYANIDLGVAEYTRTNLNNRRYYAGGWDTAFNTDDTTATNTYTYTTTTETATQYYRNLYTTTTV